MNTFDESEMPYGILARFGLTQQMIEDLPDQVLENIWSGHRSPVLPIAVKLVNGEIGRARTSFKLIRKPDDTVDILFYPRLNEYDLKLFDSEQKKKLLAGKAILGTLGEHANNGMQHYFQIDPNNRQVMSVPEPVIGRNIQYVAERYNLSVEEIQKMKNGEVLSVQDEKDTLSFGIDLNSRTGIRFAAGNEETWKRESKKEWGKYEFGIFGCWVADDDGDLNYVEEKDYTEEMWNEQKNDKRNVLSRR